MRIPGIALAAILFAASAAPAQGIDPEPRDRFEVSVFTGIRAPFTTGALHVFGADGGFISSVREQRGGNPVLGVEAEAHLRGRFGLVAGGTYSQGGIGEFFIDRDAGYGESGDYGVRYLSDSWFAKAGVSMRFDGGRRVEDGRTLPSTDVTIAPALVRQLGTNHPALNLGFEGRFPLLRQGIDVAVGIEDYMVFWRDEALQPALLELVQPVGRDAASVDLRYGSSHIPVIRLGAAFRF